MGDLKATPGPWEPHPVMRWVSPASDMETPVCALRWETEGVACDETEVRANAFLIAAAPELYEALAWFINDIDGTHTKMVEFDANVERARVALAKARGEQPQSIREGVDRD